MFVIVRPDAADIRCLSQFEGFVQSVAVNLAFFASLSLYFLLLSFGECKVGSRFVLTFGFTRCCYWRMYLYRRSSVYSAWRLYLYRRSSVYSAIRLHAGVDARGLFGQLNVQELVVVL